MMADAETPILGTGLSGLVGSRVVELLSNEFKFENISRIAGTDITNKKAVDQKLAQSQAEWIVHFAAKTDVDACELEKQQKEKSESWQINVGGTENIVLTAQKYHKRVLFISTDFVFDGTKPYYSENDLPNPPNWYGLTKYEAEKIILQYPQNIVLRIAYPYQAQKFTKPDFVHAISHKLKTTGQVSAVIDQYFCPTFIDDIAQALKLLISDKQSGVFHAVGSQTIASYEAALEIARFLGIPADTVRGVTRQEYYQGKAIRPYKLSLKNDKITSLGMHLKTLTEGLLHIKGQGFTL